MGESNKKYIEYFSMPINSCNDDFKEIKKYFEETHNISIPFNNRNVNAIKKIHGTVYGYLILKSKLKINNQANIFLSEIHSDYLQSISLVLKGYEKLAMILLRDILENTLKFIYYYDHPIEFVLLEDKNKNFIFIDDLVRYVCEHPEISHHSEKLQLLSRVKTNYAKLSKHIHSKDSNYMQLIKYLKQIKFSKTFCDKYLVEFKQIHSTIMILLILFLYKKYSLLSISDRRFILNSILKVDKKYLTSL
jgi:hypothetical protein